MLFLSPVPPRIYDDLKDVGMKYKNRIRSRVANLGDAKNPFLKKRVISGDITPRMIAVMSTQVEQ